MSDAPHVLVAYGSRNGSTAEIARWIGDALTAAGIRAEVRPAGRVHDVAGYDAVVLGSALHAGRWLRGPKRFARRNRRTLLERPVWLFTSGPLDPSAAGPDPGETPVVPAAIRVADRLDAQGSASSRGSPGRSPRTLLISRAVVAGSSMDCPDATVRTAETRSEPLICLST